MLIIKNVSYNMQMLSPNNGWEKSAPYNGLTIKYNNLDISQYLSLYTNVGLPSRWPKRELVEIEDVLRSSQIDIVILYFEERPIGLCELDKSYFQK